MPNILNLSPPRIAKDFSKIATLAKFRQIWSHWTEKKCTNLTKCVCVCVGVCVGVGECVCVYGKESMIVFRLKAEPRDRESERSIENGVKLEKDAGGFIYTHWLQGILFMILVHLRSY